MLCIECFAERPHTRAASAFAARRASSAIIVGGSSSGRRGSLTRLSATVGTFKSTGGVCRED